MDKEEEITVGNIVKFSVGNRGSIKSCTGCSCYFCLRKFSGGIIEEWSDEGKTAKCPFCSMDSVVPQILTQEKLAEANERWFTRTEEDKEDSLRKKVSKKKVKKG